MYRISYYPRINFMISWKSSFSLRMTFCNPLFLNNPGESQRVNEFPGTPCQLSSEVYYTFKFSFCCFSSLVSKPRIEHQKTFLKEISEKSLRLMTSLARSLSTSNRIFRSSLNLSLVTFGNFHRHIRHLLLDLLRICWGI